MSALTDSAQDAVAATSDRPDWYRDGFVIAATEGGDVTSKIHAGVVDTIPPTRFTMSALCRRYRTKDGNRLANPPSLCRGLAQEFAAFADGQHPITDMPVRVCCHCVSVFDDLGRPAVLDEPKPY